MWEYFLAGCLVWMVAVVPCDLSFSGPMSLSASPRPRSASDVSTSPYSLVEMTLTVDFVSSISNGSAEHEIQPTRTATTTSCSDVNWEAEPLTCADVACVEKQLENLAKKSKCMQVKPRNVTLTSMDIPEMALNIGLLLAEEMIKLTNGGGVNNTAVLTTSNIAMEVGVINSSGHLDTNKGDFLTFPNYSDQTFSAKWRSTRDSVALPIQELPNSGPTVYVVAILTDLFGNRYLAKHEMAWKDNIVALSHISELFVVGDQLFSRKKVPKKRINSNIISVSFEHEGKTLKGPLGQPLKITFHHVHDGLVEPKCVHWDKTAWSTDGCRVKETRNTHTVCECSHFASFAVVMTEDVKVDDSARRMVVTIASVLGSFSMLGLLICIIVAIVVNYHNFDNMRIALNIDVSLLFSQLVFLVGLSTSDNSFYSKPEVCEVISPFIHLFELAALTWLLVEGFYYYSTLKPFFNEKNTIPIVFYFAMGWGIPIAFASACAGYSYPHFGNPERSEFCWLFIQGKEAWFFGAPVLILVMLNIGIRACIVKEIVKWKDNPDDVKIETAKARSITSSFLMSVILMTWLFGILSVNHTEYKTLHYLFIALYTLQGLLVFFFYCVRNQEMWDYYRGKKEEEVREKNATYDFVYVP